MLENNDLQPIVAFLAQHGPYSELSDGERAELARHMSIEYLRRGAQLTRGADPGRVYLVRSGAVREQGADGRLLAHYGEGDTFGLGPTRSQGGAVEGRWDGLEDSLLYSLPGERFAKHVQASPVLQAFFSHRAGHGVQVAATESLELGPARGDALSARLSSLMQRRLVSIAPDATVRSAAQLMRRERVSCLVVQGTGGGSAEQPLAHGIVTDRDLRNRVVAEGLDVDSPVSDVMSSPVIVASPQATLLEALMLMLAERVHHLVIVDDQRPVGVVTLTDWMRVRANNPLYLLSDLERQHSVEGVAEISARREQVLVHLVEAGVGPREVHAVLTRLGDGITKRLLQLARQQLVAQGLSIPDGDWSWVAFGSQARHEQALGSDQDNGLVLGASVLSSAEAFAKLAEITCDGLARSGYPLCNGGIMASQEQCRKSLSQWENTFRRWIEEPTPEAIMRCSIFFDQRTVVGESSVAEHLMQRAVEMSAERTVFLAALARHSLARRPPLGFFRQLVVEHSGEYARTLDIKHRGVVPIVDLARIHALRAGCIHPDTRSRLVAARDVGHLSPSGCEDLLEAFEIVQRERLRHHVRCLRSGKEVDNRLRPDELSALQRLQLRDAFRVVQTMQKHLEMSQQLRELNE